VLYLHCVSCVALSECVPASVWCPVVLEHFCVWCVLVFYVLATDTEVPGSIPGATRFSE